jgi:hypothetical protein
MHLLVPRRGDEARGSLGLIDATVAANDRAVPSA